MTMEKMNHITFNNLLRSKCTQLPATTSTRCNLPALLSLTSSKIKRIFRIYISVVRVTEFRQIEQGLKWTWRVWSSSGVRTIRAITYNYRRLWTAKLLITDIMMVMAPTSLQRPQRERNFGVRGTYSPLDRARGKEVLVRYHQSTTMNRVWISRFLAIAIMPQPR